MNRFEPDKEGLRRFRLSKEVTNMIYEKGKEVQKRCGTGYTLTMYRNNQYTPVATVGTGTAAAEQDNLDNNTLLRSLR